jgi:hypothetical protein
MTIVWDFTAQTLLDQLPANDQMRVERAVAGLEGEAASARRDEVVTLVSKTGAQPIYTLRAGLDYIVIFERDGDNIVVVDVVRRGQIESLRELAHESR